MKALVLARYDSQGASSRLRTLQYRSLLAEAGIDAHFESLFDADYLFQMYAGKRSAARVIASMVRRIRTMREQADVVWLEKEALPWVPWFAEKVLWPSNTPVVTDFDDAIFHRYDQSSYPFVRGLLGEKIDKIMRASTLVTAGNQYLARRAEAAGANWVEVVPTVVDFESYQCGHTRRNDDRLRVGWIGTPETWSSLASGFSHWIEKVAVRNEVVFRVIGATHQSKVAFPFEFLPWSEESEVSLISGMDVGLMPLPDTPWTRGKCGYKLIQYMACGLPVVASPVGVNKNIVEHGVNGFLATSEGEWRSALEALLSDAELRQRMGAAGRKKVEEHYSLHVWGPRVAQMLRSVVEGRAQV